MRLFRSELYKLANRRMVKVCMGAMLAIQVFVFFLTGIYSQRSVVCGQRYSGLAAVSMDRRITEEFAGELTDGKAEKIAEKYGFVKYSGTYGMEYNYLNHFLFIGGMTNGHMHLSNENDYVNPTELISLEESIMGKLAAYKGVKARLVYAEGWRVYLTMASVGAMLVCVFVLITLTPVFAEEYSLGTANILLTTVHGKQKDIVMKIAAALVFAVCSMLIVLGFTFLLCGSVFGFGGLDGLAGVLEGTWFSAPEELFNICAISIGQYLLIMTLLQFMAVLILTAAVMFLSAAAKNAFKALVYAALFFIAPGAVYLSLTQLPMSDAVLTVLHVIMSLPMYLCMNGIVQESIYLETWIYRVVIFALIFFPSLLLGYRTYRNHQAA